MGESLSDQITSLRQLISNRLYFIMVWVGLSQLTIAQDQHLADSLEGIYHQIENTETDKLQILKLLAESHTQTEKKLTYARELIQKSQELDSIGLQFAGYLQLGNALRLKGDLSEALETYFTAASIALDEDIPRDLGIVHITIADVYSIMENHDQSLRYYQSAISILEENGDSVDLATALLNAGDEFTNARMIDSALVYFQRSGQLFEALNYELGVAYTLGNLGLAYAELGRTLEAEMNMDSAVHLLEKIGDYYPVCVYYTYLSDIYWEEGDMVKALKYARESLQIAKNYGLKDQISDANLKLSNLYEASGNLDSSYLYYKDFVLYKDSVTNITSVQEMANLRADYEVSQKQLEVDLLHAERKNQRLVVIAVSIVLLLIALLSIGLYRRNKFIRKTSRIIEQEKKRSDELLLNILPEETAEELKMQGKVEAKKFDSITVLFTDFQGFTAYAEKLPPEQVIETVDYYFSRFDQIMDKFGLEKIKTIGDAYMAAGGLPKPLPDHAERMVRAAVEMVDFVSQTQEEMGFEASEKPFNIRIGIHTGPVVAGVVGTKKFAYDIWGDTVNIAARMESSSNPGKINISESTFLLVKDLFDCNYRGEIAVKNRGILNMYFVQAEKSLVGSP